MQKNIFFLILIFLIGFGIQNASAHHFDYIGKQFDVKLDGIKTLHIEFADEPNYSLYQHNPVITQGSIVGSEGYDLAGIQFKAYSNNFVMSNPAEGWYVFGTKEKTNDYTIQIAEWDGNLFVKTEFKTKITDIQPEQKLVVREYKLMGPEPAPKKDLIVLVNQSLRNYWNDNYQIFVKVFDKNINPNPNFDQFFGAVNNAEISVILTPPDGNNAKILSGNTQNGLWQGKQYYPENIAKPGKYSVDVVVRNGDSLVTQNYTMFLFGVSANRASTTNSTAP